MENNLETALHSYLKEVDHCLNVCLCKACHYYRKKLKTELNIFGNHEVYTNGIDYENYFTKIMALRKTN